MGAIRAGRVFDGTTDLGPSTVVFEDGRITAVEKGDVPGAWDLGDDVTLLPGLVDAHVHLAFGGAPDVFATMELDDEALLTRMHESAMLQLAAGVTTVRDLGDRGFLATQLDTPLTVLASGPPLTTPKGHCWFLGGEVEGMAGILAAVQERAERGCAVVKVMASGGNITPGNTPFDPQFRLPELAAIVEEAHRLGLQTAAHAHAPVSIVEALDAGFDTLEHVSFATREGVGSTPELLQRLADSPVVISATLGMTPGAQPPPAVAARLDDIITNMQWLAANGATVVAGTDGGVGPGKPHGVLPFALAVLQPAIGLPAALRVLTAGGAEAIGLGGRKGVLVRGADADLLAVRGNPVIDDAALRDVVGVWVAGARVVGS